MFEIRLPDGFIQLKQICLRKEYWLGFSYNIEMLSILKNSEGAVFLRRYMNCCDAGANGRPCTSVRDGCYRLDNQEDISGINEKNWWKYVSNGEPRILENTGGDYVDQSALDFVKGMPDQRKR